MPSVINKEGTSAISSSTLDLDAASEEILRALNGKSVNWKPAPKMASDGLWRGLAYIREESKIRKEWDELWPASVAISAWDLEHLARSVVAW